MGELSSFYSTLFGIEIAVFGIITAALFVFIQLVYSNFSHKQIKPIFKDYFLISYFVLSILNLLITGIATLLISLGEYDFIPSLNLSTSVVFFSPYFALFCLILNFISLALFFILVVRNLRYLQPSRILLTTVKKIKYEDIRNFLLKKYGANEPNKWIYDNAIYGGVSTANIKKILSGGEEALTEKEEAEIKRKSDEADQKFKADTEEFNRTKEEVKLSVDPFEAVNEMALRAINKVDLRTLNEIIDICLPVFGKFIENASTKNKGEGWRPDKDIVENFVDYYCDEILNAQLEMSDYQKLTSLKLTVLGASNRLAKKLQEHGDFPGFNKLANFWKLLADDEIGKNQQVFKKVIEYYKEIGEEAFKREQKEIFEEIFRAVGWLGERLLSKKVPESKPLMIDNFYETDFEVIFNVLLSFTHAYEYKKPDGYPLICFDAIYVFFHRLIKVYQIEKNTDIKNRIFDCLYAYYAFAQVAIKAGNSSGAALAIMDLCNGYKELLQENVEDAAKDVVGLLVRIGATAAGFKKNLSGKDGNFLSEPLDIYVMKVLEENPGDFSDTISSEVMESYIKADNGGDRNEVWNFIKTFGRRLQTNFGFMFDWQTGELYAENDSRRK